MEMTGLPCLGCIPPRTATLVIGFITFAANGVHFLRISSLERPFTDSLDADDTSRFQAEGFKALSHFAWLWALSASIIGLVGVYGVLKSHIKSLRLFALHAVIDSIFFFLVTASLALVAFSTSISSNVGRLACAEMVRGPGPMGDRESSWFDFARSAESCEERIGTLITLFLALCAFALALRIHCAVVTWRYYVAMLRRSTTGEYELMSERKLMKQRRLSTSSTSSMSTPRGCRSRSASSDSTICASPTSGVAPRIILLPQSPSSSPPPSPSTIKAPSHALGGPGRTPPRRHTVPTPPPVSGPKAARATRSRSMSEDDADEVIVYAPVRMSMEEAQKMGGREAIWR